MYMVLVRITYQYNVVQMEELKSIFVIRPSMETNPSFLELVDFCAVSSDNQSNMLMSFFMLGGSRGIDVSEFTRYRVAVKRGTHPQHVVALRSVKTVIKFLVDISKAVDGIVKLNRVQEWVHGHGPLDLKMIATMLAHLDAVHRVAPTRLAEHVFLHFLSSLPHNGRNKLASMFRRHTIMAAVTLVLLNVHETFAVDVDGMQKHVFRRMSTSGMVFLSPSNNALNVSRYVSTKSMAMWCVKVFQWYLRPDTRALLPLLRK